MTRHVAVLLGGLSAEREVSLVSGDACARALEERGFRVSRIDAAEDLVRQLLEVRPEVVFNALHGRLGEDGRVQGLLDILGIPYTHSGVLASAVAMDKPMAKLVFASAGLRCPEGVELPLGRVLEELPMRAALRGQAGGRRFQRRRRHPATDPISARSPIATTSTPTSRCWSSASSPGASSPAACSTASPWR